MPATSYDHYNATVNFCPKCGSRKVDFDDRRNRWKCINCGLEGFQPVKKECEISVNIKER